MGGAHVEQDVPIAVRCSLTVTELQGRAVLSHCPSPRLMAYLGSRCRFTNTLPLMMRPSVTLTGLGMVGPYPTRPVVTMGEDACVGQGRYTAAAAAIQQQRQQRRRRDNVSVCTFPAWRQMSCR